MAAISQVSRVLFVEDTLDVAQIFQVYARAKALPWEVVNDAASGLARYNARRKAGYPYRLLVLDVAMIDKSGLQMAEEIRASGDVTTPIAFYTGHDGVIQRQRAEAVGARGYRLKPLSLDELRDWVNEMSETAAPAGAKENYDKPS